MSEIRHRKRLPFGDHNTHKFVSVHRLVSRTRFKKDPPSWQYHVNQKSLVIRSPLIDLWTGSSRRSQQVANSTLNVSESGKLVERNSVETDGRDKLVIAKKKRLKEKVRINRRVK